MPTFNFDNSDLKTLSDQTRKAIVTHIHDLIDEWSITEFQDAPRKHLGASIIGDECRRKLWYHFRWVKQELFEGRMLRLFQDGNRQEAEFIKMLRGIGFDVKEIDPDTDKQFRIKLIAGQYGGSCDGKAIMPFLPNFHILLEFKTHNSKSFLYLKNKGSVKLAKPQHYAQMCGYGKEMNLKYGLYCAKNKNDSDLYFELVDLDWNYAVELERKAYDVITAENPPNRIAENPAFFQCNFCTYRGVCHEGEPVAINCRSCRYAKPVDDAKWFCQLYNGEIPEDFIAKGCDKHVSINRI